MVSSPAWGQNRLALGFVVAVCYVYSLNLGGWSCNCFLTAFSRSFRALTEITWLSSSGIMGKAMVLMLSNLLEDFIFHSNGNWQTRELPLFSCPDLVLYPVSLKASVESQSFRAGYATGPYPIKLLMAAGTRGPTPPGKGRALVCDWGGGAGDCAILLL